MDTTGPVFPAVSCGNAFVRLNESQFIFSPCCIVTRPVALLHDVFLRAIPYVSASRSPQRLRYFHFLVFCFIFFFVPTSFDPPILFPPLCRQIRYPTGTLKTRDKSASSSSFLRTDLGKLIAFLAPRPSAFFSSCQSLFLFPLSFPDFTPSRMKTAGIPDSLLPQPFCLPFPFC